MKVRRLIVVFDLPAAGGLRPYGEAEELRRQKR
jgi:hypothetical protein